MEAKRSIPVFFQKQIVYIVASNRYVQSVEIVQILDRDTYLVRFEHGGSIELKTDRIYGREADAQAALKEIQKRRKMENSLKSLREKRI